MYKIILIIGVVVAAVILATIVYTFIRDYIKERKGGTCPYCRRNECNYWYGGMCRFSGSKK